MIKQKYLKCIVDDAKSKKIKIINTVRVSIYVFTHNDDDIKSTLLIFVDSLTKYSILKLEVSWIGKEYKWSTICVAARTRGFLTVLHNSFLTHNNSKVVLVKLIY